INLANSPLWDWVFPLSSLALIAEFITDYSTSRIKVQDILIKSFIIALLYVTCELGTFIKTTSHSCEEGRETLFSKLVSKVKGVSFRVTFFLELGLMYIFAV